MEGREKTTTVAVFFLPLPSTPLPSSSFSLSSTLFDTYRASPQASSEFEIQDGTGLISLRSLDKIRPHYRLKFICLFPFL